MRQRAVVPAVARNNAPARSIGETRERGALAEELAILEREATEIVKAKAQRDLRDARPCNAA